jgi:hypothetical protein
LGLASEPTVPGLSVRSVSEEKENPRNVTEVFLNRGEEGL